MSYYARRNKFTPSGSISEVLCDFIERHVQQPGNLFIPRIISHYYIYLAIIPSFCRSIDRALTREQFELTRENRIVKSHDEKRDYGVRMRRLNYVRAVRGIIRRLEHLQRNAKRCGRILRSLWAFHRFSPTTRRVSASIWTSTWLPHFT
jgi:hypothetical protein